MQVKFCRDCRHSTDEDSTGLRCQHPIVNANDQWALSSIKKFRGTSCANERGLKFWSFPKCGMNGKLWESK